MKERVVCYVTYSRVAGDENIASIFERLGWMDKGCEVPEMYLEKKSEI